MLPNNSMLFAPCGRRTVASLRPQMLGVALARLTPGEALFKARSRDEEEEVHGAHRERDLPRELCVVC